MSDAEWEYRFTHLYWPAYIAERKSKGLGEPDMSAEGMLDFLRFVDRFSVALAEYYRRQEKKGAQAADVGPGLPPGYNDGPDG